MRLHRVVDGPPAAPPIVLSGSLGSTHELWDAQAAALSDRHRVIRYDRRGHGASSVPAGPYSIEDLGRDALELLDELGLERVSFCGLSLGGMVGMWLASEAPQRIDRLTLCCTAAELPPREQWVERAALVRERGVEPLAKTVLARWFTPAAPASLVERFRAMLVSTPREGYAGCCEAIGALDLRDRLGSISAPTLVVTGVEDPVATPATGEALAAAIPGARHVSLPGAHLVSAESPGPFNDLLRDQLEDAA